MGLFFRVPKAVKVAEATLKEKILQMDIPGFLLVLALVICYLLAMQWGGEVKSWGSADIIGTLVVPLCSSSLFLLSNVIKVKELFCYRVF
jgi:MFS transporter, DHA2 family, glioxin efflux transporter